MDAFEYQDEILKRLASGESLRAICRSPGFPAESSVRFRVIDDPEFAAQYARARNSGLDCIAEEINEISEDRADEPNSRRVRIDARKWFLSKLRPDKYGDAVRQEITGSGGQPITFVIQPIESPKGGNTDPTTA